MTRHRYFHGGIAAATLAVALTAACGGSTPKASSPAGSGPAKPAAGSAATRTGGATDFCRLVTRDEAQAAVGKPLLAGVSLPVKVTVGGRQGNCKYLSSYVNPATHSKSLVSVIVLGTKLTRAQYDDVVSEAGASAKPISGLGETAIFFSGIVATFDHGVALTLQIVRDDRSVPSEDVMTKLAGTALGRARGLL